MDIQILNSFFKNCGDEISHDIVFSYFHNRCGRYIDKFWGVMPISFCEMDVSTYDPLDFLFAEKKNGVRALLYCYNGQIAFQTRDNNVHCYNISFRGSPGIFDVEIFDNMIVVFDCLYSDEADGESFEERMGDVNVFVSLNKKLRDIKVLPQVYNAIDNLNCLNDCEGEGIILVRRTGKIKEYGSIYKWKKPSLCTIDLKVIDGVASTSDDIELLQLEVDNGIWEVSCSGDVIGKRLKDTCNNSIVVCNVWRNYLCDYTNFKRFFFLNDDVLPVVDIDDVMDGLNLNLRHSVNEISIEDKGSDMNYTKQESRKKKKYYRNNNIVTSNTTFVDDRFIVSHGDVIKENFDWHGIKHRLFVKYEGSKFYDNIRKSICSCTLLIDDGRLFIGRNNRKISLPLFEGTANTIYNMFVRIIDNEVRKYIRHIKGIISSCLLNDKINEKELLEIINILSFVCPCTSLAKYYKEDYISRDKNNIVRRGRKFQRFKWLYLINH